MERYPGEKTPKLGFGLMRLPKLESGAIDIEQTKQMVDMFMDAGMTYFDTAYVYDNGESEKAARAALVERYPRDSFTLCTKMCGWGDVHDKASVAAAFQTSLDRTGAGYFDYYLLHAIQRSNYKAYEEYDVWNFVRAQKEKGLVRRWGFSFHADPALLTELLTQNPDVDFVQLQINYADWDNPGVAARECWEICKAHGKPVVVMEPVKGGALANPIPQVQEVLKAAAPEMSCASWAVRYAASLDNIITVLSGMSNTMQMADNLSYMKDFVPLNAEEQAVIKKAQEALQADQSIPCTACHYCTDGCPVGIPIPEIFAVRNQADRFKARDGGKGDYRIAVQGKGKAGDCVQCGQCESVCPQQLPIISLLEKCQEMEG